MEKPAMLGLSPRDRDRWKVWPEAGSGHRTPAPAGAPLQRRGRWGEHDTTQEKLRLLGTYLERWGRPGEFYKV